MEDSDEESVQTYSGILQSRDDSTFYASVYILSIDKLLK
jgi:hypothetical protein